MNQKTLMLKKLASRNHIKLGVNNALKCSHRGTGNSPAESPEHRRYKWLVVDWCYENNVQFTTEAVLNNGSRADLVLWDFGIIIEIRHSETNAKTLQKNYPLPIIPYNTCDSEKDLVSMLDELRDTEGSAMDYYLKKYGCSK